MFNDSKTRQSQSPHQGSTATAKAGSRIRRGPALRCQLLETPSAFERRYAKGRAAARRRKT